MSDTFDDLWNLDADEACLVRAARLLVVLRVLRALGELRRKGRA